MIPTTLTSTTHRPLSWLVLRLDIDQALEDVYTKAWASNIVTGHGGLGPDEGTSNVYQDVLLLSIVYNYKTYGSEVL